MRAFNFKARSIGDEKYLTYTMDEDCELDDSVLDYCEDNKIKELVEIIYEEDDEYDYLTYDITGGVSLEDFIANEIKCETAVSLIRNIALELIDLREQNIQLSYLLLNRNFMYVDVNDYGVRFICIPIETNASVTVEFKAFVRQLLANMKYDIEEDLNYVGKLLTYINGDNFNLRGLIGLCEALLDEAGVSFVENDSINAEGGVEVVEADENVQSESHDVNSFMSDIPQADEEPLPEIGDDEEEEETDESVSANSIVEEETTAEVKQADDKETETEEKVTVQEKSETKFHTSELKLQSRQTGDKKELDMDLVKNRIREIVSNGPAPKQAKQETIGSLAELDDYLGGKPPVIKKNVVKVNRAALIQNLAEQESEMDEAEEQTEATVEEKTEVEATVKETTTDSNETEVQEEKEPTSNSVLSKTVADIAKQTKLSSIPQAIPYLVRVNTEERVMLDRTVFKIGKGNRGVDYSIRGNSAISRQHAIILQKDGVCYIKDNKSTNHTYVNGKMVEDGVEEILTHDSLITLGDEDFLFKIR